jgi:tetratricopeptide (TPR) repeat protein
LGDDGWTASALNSLAEVAHDEQDFQRSRGLYLESLALARRLQDRWRLGAALNNLGSLEQELGNLQAAQSLEEEALALFQDLRDARNVAGIQTNLAEIAIGRGDGARALDLSEQALAAFHVSEDKPGVLEALIQRARARALLGRRRDAELDFAEALALAEEIGDPITARAVRESRETFLRSEG